MPQPEASRGSGEIEPLRGTIDDAAIRLEPARLESLTGTQEAEALDLLAALLAAAVRRRADRRRLEEAA